MNIAIDPAAQPTLVTTALLPPNQATSGTDLKKAAQAFEAIFVRQMLSSARAADFGGDDLFGGPGLEQFEVMRDEHVAEIASTTGALGLAATIEAQLAARMEHG